MCAALHWRYGSHRRIFCAAKRQLVNARTSAFSQATQNPALSITHDALRDPAAHPAPIRPNAESQRHPTTRPRPTPLASPQRRPYITRPNPDWDWSDDFLDASLPRHVGRPRVLPDHGGRLRDLGHRRRGAAVRLRHLGRQGRRPDHRGARGPAGRPAAGRRPVPPVAAGHRHDPRDAPRGRQRGRPVADQPGGGRAGGAAARHCGAGRSGAAGGILRAAVPRPGRPVRPGHVRRGAAQQQPDRGAISRTRCATP